VDSKRERARHHHCAASQLTDKPYTGKYRVREGHLPRFGFSIPRADVADFMIQTAENGAFRNSVAGVCA
jgi:hypothetical protein